MYDVMYMYGLIHLESKIRIIEKTYRHLVSKKVLLLEAKYYYRLCLVTVVLNGRKIGEFVVL